MSILAETVEIIYIMVFVSPRSNRNDRTGTIQKARQGVYCKYKATLDYIKSAKATQ